MTNAPPLRNDCFALPAGVDWTPVDDALARLKASLHEVVGQEEIALVAAGGRVLSTDVMAVSSNPPFSNSAVDGYGFAFSGLSGAEIEELPISFAIASAGHREDDPVAKGEAIRILTGARLPSGVDTVVLDEDVTVESGIVRFRTGLKPHANTRAAGEDVEAGTKLFVKGHIIGAADIALMRACGVSKVDVFNRLKVAVLSTGDEVTDADHFAHQGQIFDANRPMLSEMIRAWGFETVDLGHVLDDADAIKAKLDEGASYADAILTTGGASAGDEDHISKLLGATGHMQTWRIAVKPGRPLALAMWNGTPVFGLPGNPVAAFVCSLIFGYPALSALAGGGWKEPLKLSVPASFSKSKKNGRREYLRARLTPEGHAEVFKSEGSGRISGLSWATGLVELDDHGYDIEEGDKVAFLPFANFGL